MEDEEKIRIANEIYNSSQSEDAEKKIEDILYYEEFEFLKEEKDYYKFSEKDVFAIVKSEKKDDKDVLLYEIYNKKGERIANCNENGEIEFTDEYKAKLEKMPKEFYDKIGFDKRKMKMDIVEKSQEDKEKNEEEKEHSLEKAGIKVENKDKKEEKQKNAEVPEKQEEKIAKMGEDLDVNPDDIRSSSEIKDKEFYKLVPEARTDFKGWVSIVYIGSTNEFKVIGQDIKTGKFKQLDTVLPSQAVEQKSTIDIESQGQNVERKSLGNIGGVLKIKGNNEYSFAANIKEFRPIEFKELRREKNTGEYIATEMTTSHQWPTNREADKIMEKRENEDTIDEVKAYREEEIKGNKIVNQEKIKDENTKKAKQDKEKEDEQAEEEKQKVPWEHLKKYGY